MSEKMKPVILNLCEAMPSSLEDFLKRSNCETVSRENVQDYESLDFVIVDSEEEANQAEKDFESSKNEITVVCLGPVKEVKSFLLKNGRLSIDPEFLNSKLGEAILNKFFNKQYNIHLDESFSGLFPAVESFKVTNHLALGSSLDELSLKAFENDFNIVALRSFFDHALIYFTYLKQAGLAGVPYEVEHSFNQDFFAVNMHAPVKNFVAEYLIDSFGSVNSSDPLRYLLGVTSRSADFMDVTYVEDPGRIVISGFWSKSAARKLNGLAFNNVKTTSQLNVQLERKLKQFKPSEESKAGFDSLAENLEAKNLPGGILELALNQDQNSILNKDPEKASSLIAFAIGRFEEINPDASVNEMGEEDLVKIISQYPDEEAAQSLVEGDLASLLDNIHKKNITDAYNEELQRVRESLEEEDDFKQELSNSLNEEVVKRVSSTLDAEDLNRLISGKEEEDNHSQTVKGKKDVDDFKAVIKGAKENHKDDFAQRVSGSFEKHAGKFTARISGSGENPEKGVLNFVSLALEGIDDLDVDEKAKKYFKTKASESLSDNLRDFAERLGLQTPELSESDLIRFKKERLPSLVEEVLSDEASIEEFVASLEVPIDRTSQLLDNASPEFREKFKHKLESKLDKVEGFEKVDDRYVFTDENVGQEETQKIIQTILKETLDEEFKLEKANKEELEETEKLIVKKLSESFGKDSGEMAKLAEGASQKAKEKETQKVVENLFKEKPENKVKSSNIEETQLLDKLKKAEQENKKLQDSLKGMQVKFEAYQASQEVAKQVDQKAKEEALEEIKEATVQVSQIEKDMEEINQETLTNLKQGQSIDKEDAIKIAKVVERERLLIRNAKEAETNFRKMEIEHKKKEGLFMSEIEKANKSLRAKDIVVDKVKESMQALVEKKQAQANSYKKQVEELNQRLKDDRAVKLDAELKAVKKEYESLGKVAEMYKSKVDNMIKTQKKSEAENDAEKLISENRSLGRFKVQLENKLNSEIKQRKSLESQFAKLKDQEGKLRARATGAEARLKEIQGEMEKFKANEARLVSLAEKKQTGADPKALKEIETLKTQNAQLHNSLQEMVEKVKSAGAGGAGAVPTGTGGGGTKEKHLEQSVKKLNSELAKARNEVNEQKKLAQKYKNEAVGLKNKIAQLQKANGGKKKAA